MTKEVKKEESTVAAEAPVSKINDQVAGIAAIIRQHMVTDEAAGTVGEKEKSSAFIAALPPDLTANQVTSLRTQDANFTAATALVTGEWGLDAMVGNKSLAVVTGSFDMLGGVSSKPTVHRSKTFVPPRAPDGAERPSVVHYLYTTAVVSNTNTSGKPFTQVSAHLREMGANLLKDS